MKLIMVRDLRDTSKITITNYNSIINMHYTNYTHYSFYLCRRIHQCSVQSKMRGKAILPYRDVHVEVLGVYRRIWKQLCCPLQPITHRTHHPRRNETDRLRDGERGWEQTRRVQGSRSHRFSRLPNYQTIHWRNYH